MAKISGRSAWAMNLNRPGLAGLAKIQHSMSCEPCDNLGT